MKNFNSVAEHRDEYVILPDRAQHDKKGEYFVLNNSRDQVYEEAVSGDPDEDHHEVGEVSEHADGDGIVFHHTKSDGRYNMLTYRSKKALIEESPGVRGGMKLSNSPASSNHPPVTNTAHSDKVTNSDGDYHTSTSVQKTNRSRSDHFIVSK